MTDKRLFRISDLELIQHCETAYSILAKSLKDFQEKDTHYSTKKLVELKGLIEDAKMQTDEQVSDQQAWLTEQLNQVRLQCEQHFQEISYFIKKAFKEDIKTQHILGVNDFNTAKRSKLGMIQFMRILYETLPTYTTALEGVGLPPETINKTKALSERLNELNVEQQVFKRNRTKLTATRIERVNRLYAAFKELEELATLVYRNNMTALQSFIVPRYQQSSPIDRPQGTSIEGNTKRPALSEFISSGQLLHLVNHGSVPLHFYVATDTNTKVAEKAVVLSAGETQHVLPEVISDGEMGKVIVWNAEQGEGRFEVRVV